MAKEDPHAKYISFVNSAVATDFPREDDLKAYLAGIGAEKDRYRSAYLTESARVSWDIEDGQVKELIISVRAMDIIRLFPQLKALFEASFGPGQSMMAGTVPFFEWKRGGKLVQIACWPVGDHVVTISILQVSTQASFGQEATPESAPVPFEQAPIAPGAYPDSPHLPPVAPPGAMPASPYLPPVAPPTMAPQAIPFEPPLVPPVAVPPAMDTPATEPPADPFVTPVPPAEPPVSEH